jgi:hypothetical protein
MNVGGDTDVERAIAVGAAYGRLQELSETGLLVDCPMALAALPQPTIGAGRKAPRLPSRVPLDYDMLAFAMALENTGPGGVGEILVGGNGVIPVMERTLTVQLKLTTDGYMFERLVVPHGKAQLLFLYSVVVPAMLDSGNDGFLREAQTLLKFMQWLRARFRRAPSDDGVPYGIRVLKDILRTHRRCVALLPDLKRQFRLSG